MTVAWAFDRYSFGRPLASYQELKHRFADMKTWLEASHTVTDAAAVRRGRRHTARPSSSAWPPPSSESTAGEMLPGCVQIHGGIGLTYEHDLHLLLRRVTLEPGATEAHPRSITAGGSPSLPDQSKERGSDIPVTEDVERFGTRAHAWGGGQPRQKPTRSLYEGAFHTNLTEEQEWAEVDRERPVAAHVLRGGLRRRLRPPGSTAGKG